MSAVILIMKVAYCIGLSRNADETIKEPYEKYMGETLENNEDETALPCVMKYLAKTDGSGALPYHVL